ncbi:TlpA family protein disulfide reductase [bacterium BMS3Abin03]|nr:TlpA family protein disulfide reductase [bacterium BMS3Abin03]MCG6959415.1 TlpA family protein disulfide reductase [bacterium BMS3Abin03]
MKNFISPLIIIFILLIGIDPVYGQGKDFNVENLAVESIGIKKLNSLIKNRNGKYLLLNIWATWCIPCREEFPALNKLHERYNDQIEFIGLSVDYPDEVESKIKPFLDSLNIKFNNYVNAENDQDKFITNLEPGWSGTVPATFIYDTSGKRVKYFTGGKTFEEFEKEISELIN